MIFNKYVIFYEDLENNKRYFLNKTGLVRKNSKRTKAH